MMKSLLASLLLAVALVGCKTDSPTAPVMTGPDPTEGTLLRTAVLATDPGGPSTLGAVAIRDVNGTLRVVFTELRSDFSTGRLAVYLSKTASYNSATDAKVGFLQAGGTQVMTVPSGVTLTGRDFVTLYCESAALQFAHGALAVVSGGGSSETTLKQGTFAQTLEETAGSVAIVRDGAGAETVRLLSGFTTSLGTGTVDLYLTNTNPFDPASSLKVARLTRTGAQAFTVPSGTGAGYARAVVYCTSARLVFGVATLAAP